MDLLAFYVLGGLTVLASLLVVGQRNPMYSVLLLIVSFGGLAGLYIQLDSPFVAVAQIIIYAGAIMVLFLFVVMLLNVPREDLTGGAGVPPVAGPRRFGVLLALLLAVELGWALFNLNEGWVAGQRGESSTVSSVRAVGMALYSDYAFAFEATSILILVAMVGAVVLARRER